MSWDIVPVRDNVLFVHHDEDLSNHIKREQDYFEAPILDYMRDNYGTHGTILDVGANVGNHSIYFSHYLEYEKLYAFEPLYANYVLLVNNAICNAGKRIETCNWGLSNINGNLHMTPNISNMGAGEISPAGSEEIRVYPLDHFNFKDVSLMKIDVEWHEPEVIEGGWETINRDRPLILIEDALDVYKQLLPSYYSLVKGWPEHKTYLYGA